MRETDKEGTTKKVRDQMERNYLVCKKVKERKKKQ